MSTATIHDLGTGSLNWNRGERIGDRYGAIYLFQEGEHEISAMRRFGDHEDLRGKIGTLKVEVLEAKASDHIGDIAIGIGPGSEDSRPKAGEVVELGHGTLFMEEDAGLGVKPDREMAIEGVSSQHDYTECDACEGSGYAPEANKISDAFYALGLPNGPERDRVRWNDKITQDEADALLEAGRFNPVIDCPVRGCNRDNPKPDCEECKGWGWTRKVLGAGDMTAEEINAQQVGAGGHDGINRLILIEARCKRLGHELSCPKCEGHGNIPPEGVERGKDRPLPADRDNWWLNVPALYSVHNMEVRLLFEEDE